MSVVDATGTLIVDGARIRTETGQVLVVYGSSNETGEYFYSAAECTIVGNNVPLTRDLPLSQQPTTQNSGVHSVVWGG